MDFSGFAVLLEETYRACHIENQLPFCMFQHAYVVLLNAYLITQQKFNSDSRFSSFEDPLAIIDASNIVIPKPIYLYIQGIGQSLTWSGETVQVNLPVGGTPRGPGDGLTSGSFGPLTAENHNAYECYFSPYVSQKLIERTLQVNKAKAKEERNFGDWNPFPNGTFPAEGIPNENLLGYKQPERLPATSIFLLEKCKFNNGPTIIGKLCYSPACISQTSSAMRRLQTIETTMAVFTAENNIATFIYKQLGEVIKDGSRIANYSAKLLSPYTFGASASNGANYFGYKRNRLETAPGSCMLLANKEEIPGFVETRNANFKMVEPYLHHII